MRLSLLHPSFGFGGLTAGLGRPDRQAVEPRTLELRQIILGVCCLLIATISVHDAALIVTNHEVINEVEQNPIGLWLLDLQNGQVWLFVFAKLFGTALVCAVILTIYNHQQRIAMTVAGSLVCFQTALLCYLTVA